MKKALDAIFRLLEKGDGEGILQLLAECQDAAIALGSHIEKLYGMQTQTVAALEQYCNALYQVSIAVNNYDASEQAQQMMETSIEELTQVTQQIAAIYDAEFPERSEVVFLPYNASMWDSLESVWMAADADPDCDAYVVPIPYYKLEANQSIKELCYEGEQYPENVPVVHYEDYDIELRQPDKIFIHNPYDGANFVTSVLPEFYSSRIKEFTDQLVYIPYFVLGEINPDDEDAVEGMKHFCVLPGVIHADKVIVQSEEIREIYIREYRKAFLKQGIKISRKELEEKILALGSPKFDKVATTIQEGVEIPKEWQPIIEKPDGSRKKIIFYNTSLAAFLNASEEMLTKIQDVLRTFEESQSDIALLWRPHPLMEQTIAAQRPALLERYQAIVKQYCEAGWGIYDDSADMDRAVVISDAYYGDWSSVVQVYQETGKPIMIQNVDIID